MHTKPQMKLWDPFSHTFQSRGPLLVLFSEIQGQIFGPRQKCCDKCHYFCKIYNFVEQNFLQDQQFGQKFQKVNLNTVAKCRKVLLMGAWIPKYGLNQKKFACIFYSNLSEKNLGQAFFHQSNILGSISPFIALQPTKLKFWRFSRHFLTIQAKLLVLDKNVVELSPIIFARSTTLQNKILMQDQQFGQKFQKVISITVAKCQKVSPRGAYSPKYGLNQKNFVCIFFPHTLLKKNWDKHFFIRTIFWDLLVFSQLCDQRNSNFGLFRDIF